MEMLNETLEMVRRHDYESDHVESAWEGEAMVRDLIQDFESHRERVGRFTAGRAPGGARVGGNPEPSELTPLTKP